MEENLFFCSQKKNKNSLNKVSEQCKSTLYLLIFHTLSQQLTIGNCVHYPVKSKTKNKIETFRWNSFQSIFSRALSYWSNMLYWNILFETINHEPSWDKGQMEHSQR